MCAQSQTVLQQQEYSMFLNAGYFDESTDEFEDRCYTVAGYMVPGLQSAIFDLRWRDLLNRWGLAYFKASEIETGFGEFAKYRDDPKALHKPLSQREKDLIREIKTSFVDAICEEPDLWGLSATISLRDYHLLQIEEPDLAKKLPKPYHLCGHLVMMEAGFIMNASNAISPTESCGILRPIFDSHRDYSFHFIESFDVFCYKNPISSQTLLPPIYEKEQHYRCLQAADCLAYEARRLVDNMLHDPGRDMRIAMVRLYNNMRKMYYVDYKTLKMLASKQTLPDTIPIEPILSREKRWNRNR